jgi:hypothetical protein
MATEIFAVLPRIRHNQLNQIRPRSIHKFVGRLGIARRLKPILAQQNAHILYNRNIPAKSALPLVPA